MFLAKKRMLIALVLNASLVPVALGQESRPVPRADSPAPTTQQPRTTTPQSETPAVTDYTQEKGFKGKVFDVKHRDPASLVRALNPLGSGFKGAVIRFEREFNTITVRDFPENIAAIEEALKRLDTPQPLSPDIELHIHVLIASNIEGAANQYPAELGDVVRQMQATLNYKSYYLLSSIVHRIKDGTRGINGRGDAQLQAPLIQGTGNAQYDYRIGILSTTSDSSGKITTEVNDLSFTMQSVMTVLGTAHIGTSLSARDGEKVVVGTASLKDKAMILVLSAKAVK